MTSNLGPPPFGMPVGTANLKVLRKDHELCRVFDWRAAASGGYSALDFNPTIPKPKAGGRFDATPGDPFGYLYGALAQDGAAVAIIETLRPLLQLDNGRRRRVIPLAQLETRALQHFELSGELALASLRDTSALTRLNAPEEVCYDPTRSMTKEWGRYFRSELPGDISGLSYNAMRATTEISKNDFSFVLWADRIHGVRLTPTARVIKLSEGAGRDIVEDVLAPFNVQVI